MQLRRGFGRSIAVAASATLIGVSSASPAAASTQVGQTFTPINTCATVSTFLQAASPDNQYVVPFDGVITSWSHQGGASSPPTLKFKVARPQGGTVFTIIGESDAEPIGIGALNVFAVRIPVRGGDVIGFHDAVDGACRRNAIGYAVLSSPGDVPPGAPTDFPGTLPGSQLDVAATLEADCDGDGFGDETQDPAVDCVPPDTVITGGPPPKTRRRKATFEFSSDEPGSALQCSIDGSSFHGCGSPFKLLKVKKGTHTFEVRARDAAGNVDGSPASYGWRVKKKKRKG